MAETPAWLHPPGPSERLESWIIVVLVRVAAIPVFCLLVAALWLRVRLWTVPLVVAMVTILAAIMYMRRRKRELEEIEREILREEYERTAREIEALREALNNGTSPNAPSPRLTSFPSLRA
jgi:Flp pilus assembly protein TadB